MSDKEIIKLYFCKKCKRFLSTENYYQGKGYCELRFMKGGNANPVENVAETGINVTETAEKCTSTVPGYTKHSIAQHSIAKHTSSSTGSSKPVKEWTKDLYTSRKYSHRGARVLSCGSESLFVEGMKVVLLPGVSTLGSR